jgi:DNA-binding response OmpR family regulator
MAEQILRNVRVLIVEDQPIQLKAFEKHLDAIDEDSRRAWGIDSFHSSLASSVEEADGFHRVAAEWPYDILILDLELPKKKGDRNVSTKYGQGFLESVSKKAVKEVLIVSSFYGYQNVIKAIRKGAVDFISKPYRRDLLQARVMESWKRVLEKDSADLLQKRVKDLVHYNERGLAYRHTVCFNNFVKDISYRATKLEDHVNERYGLNRSRDSEDYLIQSLIGFEDSIDAAKQMWERLQVPSLPEAEKPGPEVVERALRELGQSLMPCLMVKRVRLETLYSGETNVLTFQNDVRAILKEILSGSLEELPDYNSPHDDAKQDSSSKEFPYLIKIEVSANEATARVTFTDNLPPISAKDAEQINTGSFTVSQQRFSRVWGLAVMQHIAVLGGGRLIVEPQEQGNIITFLIPLENNA